MDEVIADSNRNIFPVVDFNSQLAGIILLDNIRKIMFKADMYTKVIEKELMRKPPAVISPGEDMHSIMKMFDETGAWNLPVIENERYVGFISKSVLLMKYRHQLRRCP